MIPAIWIDDREERRRDLSSGQDLPPFSSFLDPQRVEPRVTRLDDDLAGDFVWSGFTEDGRPAVIGAERKRVDELAELMIGSHRHLEQLERLALSTNYRYLILEGEYRVNQGGLMEIPWVSQDVRIDRWGQMKPATQIRSFRKHLIGLEAKYGLWTIRTTDIKDTASALMDLAEWWSRPIEEHGSLFEKQQLFSFVGKASLAKRVYRELGGIGLKWVDALEEKYPTPFKFNRATVKQLSELKVDGRRLGQKRAEKIHAEWRGQ